MAPGQYSRVVVEFKMWHLVASQSVGNSNIISRGESNEWTRQRQIAGGHLCLSIKQLFMHQPWRKKLRGGFFRLESYSPETDWSVEKILDDLNCGHHYYEPDSGGAILVSERVGVGVF